MLLNSSKNNCRKLFKKGHILSIDYFYHQENKNKQVKFLISGFFVKKLENVIGCLICTLNLMRCKENDKYSENKNVCAVKKTKYGGIFFFSNL